MPEQAVKRRAVRRPKSLVLSKRTRQLKKLGELTGQYTLLLVTSVSALAVLFIFYYIARDAVPFFLPEGATFQQIAARAKEFFFNTEWYPSRAGDPHFGAGALFVGSFLVTIGATLVAVPIGVSAAVCMSEILPFQLRQLVKPVIEMLAAIPSVAFGFFALVVFAPLLQRQGGALLSLAVWVIGTPLALLISIVASDLFTNKKTTRLFAGFTICGLCFLGLAALAGHLAGIKIESGTNALNVSIILGIMAMPTVASVSEDALQAVGRDLREGSYALGATRAETIVKVVIPAAWSGICAAIILGVMRAIGETMVVWMASGNAAQIPTPFYDFLEPVRTLTATIAGDMGEADQVTGSDRYHVLFALALCLLVFSFGLNWLAERAVRGVRVRSSRH